MGAQRWLVVALVALPFFGFSLWVLGQFLKARRDETDNVLRKGLRAEAEVVSVDRGVRGSSIRLRFSASGWQHPITVTRKFPPGRDFLAGERVAVRYLPGHPHICVVLPLQ